MCWTHETPKRRILFSKEEDAIFGQFERYEFKKVADGLLSFHLEFWRLCLRLAKAATQVWLVYWILHWLWELEYRFNQTGLESNVITCTAMGRSFFKNQRPWVSYVKFLQEVISNVGKATRSMSLDFEFYSKGNFLSIHKITLHS